MIELKSHRGLSNHSNRKSCAPATTQDPDFDGSAPKRSNYYSFEGCRSMEEMRELQGGNIMPVTVYKPGDPEFEKIAAQCTPIKDIPHFSPASREPFEDIPHFSPASREPFEEEDD